MKRRPIPISRELNRRQVRELLASAHAPDPEVANRTLTDVYRLDQNRSLLVFEDGRGRLYESRTALLDMMDAIEKEPPSPTLAELCPEGREFPTHAKRLADELGIVAPSDLDGFVHRLGVETCLTHPTFSQLVAYVGEAIRRKRGGDWQMRLAADGNSWEPWLVDAEGRAHPAFRLVFKELVEWGPESSLAGAVSYQLP